MIFRTSTAAIVAFAAIGSLLPGAASVTRHVATVEGAPQAEIVVKSVGADGRQFSTLRAWERHRGGNLVTRHLVGVTPGDRRFRSSEAVSGAGCTGIYRPENESRVNGPRMTLDDVSGLCIPGGLLVGEISGATATVVAVASTGGTIEKAEVYDDGPQTTPVVIDGSVTDAAHYLWLSAAPGHEPAGAPGSGARLIVNVQQGAAVEVADPFIVIEQLEIVNTATSGDAHAVVTTAPTGTWFHGLIVRASGGAAIYNPPALVTNLLVHDSAIGVRSASASDSSILNATIVGVAYGVLNVLDKGPQLVNVAVHSAPETAFVNTSGKGWAAGSGHNAGPIDSHPPGRHRRVGLEPADFRDLAGRDFRPSPTSLLRDTGDNLSTLFTDDITGAPRGRWDIGAFAARTIDATAPRRANPGPGGLLPAGTSTATLSLTTDDPAVCRYGPSADTPYVALPSRFAVTGGRTHSSLIRDLADGADYSFSVRCRNAAGIINTDDFVIAFAIAPPDTAAPVLTDGSPAGTLPAGTTETILALVTSENATCRYGFVAGTEYAGLPSRFDTTEGTIHATPLGGLTDGGTYTVYVRCQDVAGNPNLADYVIAFDVAVPDTTPPVRSAGAPAGTLPPGTTSTVLLLTTDEDATCRLGPVADTLYGALPSAFAVTGGTEHTTSLGGLVDGGTYTFYVRCQDTAGNSNDADLVVAFGIGATTIFDTIPDNTWLRLEMVPTVRYVCVSHVNCTVPSLLSHPVGRNWSGVRSGDGKLFYFGGGHGGNAGNDMEVFDIATLTWTQQYQPEGIPVGCFATPPVADPACIIPFGGGGSALPTPLGRPSVEHAFQRLGYDAFRHHLVAGLASGTWAFDEATQWTLLGPPPPPSTEPHTKLMVFDPGLATMLWFATTQHTRGVFAFDYATATWSFRSPIPAEVSWGEIYSAYDPVRRRHLVSHEHAGLWWYDTAAGTWTPLPDVPADLGFVSSLAFDTVNSVFVLLRSQVDGTFVMYAYDQAGAWIRLAPAGIPPFSTFAIWPHGGSWGTLNWDPVHEVFVFVNVHTGNAELGAGGHFEGDVDTWAYRYRRVRTP